MHGPEQLLLHVPYITAGEAILDTLRVSQTGERARSRPAFLEVSRGPCRASAGGRRPDYSIGIFRGRSCDIFEDPRRGTHASGEAFSAKARLMMKYRDIEYTVLQGIERGVWKWSASVADVVISGQQPIKPEAVAAAEKAIDRALASKKVRLVPLPRRWD